MEMMLGCSSWFKIDTYVVCVHVSVIWCMFECVCVCVCVRVCTSLSVVHMYVCVVFMYVKFNGNFSEYGVAYMLINDS